MTNIIKKPPVLDITGQKIAETLEKIYKAMSGDESNEIYGVQRVLTSTSWTRTDSATGLTANATLDGSTVQNDFDNIYPWSDIITLNLTNGGVVTAEYGDVDFAFDGSNGEVMTLIPEFYIKRWQDSTNEYIQIAKHHFEGAVHIEPFYIGRYTTSSGAHSVSGVLSQTSTTITNFRTQAKAKGDKWQQLDWHYFVLQCLYLVEYANADSQSVLGQGRSLSSNTAQIVSGGCDSLGMKSGCLVNDGTSSVIYRGIENPFGNIWQFVDGINIKDNVAYIDYNPDTYAVDTFDGDYKALSYTNATSNGNPNRMGYDSDNQLIGFPTIVGTSTYGDYYWQNTGNRIVVVGGSWYYGGSVGFFYWSCYHASSISYGDIGSRLLRSV